MIQAKTVFAELVHQLSLFVEMHGHIADSEAVLNRANEVLEKEKAEASQKELVGEFEQFRLAYLGKKRGSTTEFDQIKKVKGFAQIIPTLHDGYVATDAVAHQRLIQQGKREMIPHLRTYIHQKRWEMWENIEPLDDYARFCAKLSQGVVISRPEYEDLVAKSGDWHGLYRSFTPQTIDRAIARVSQGAGVGQTFFTRTKNILYI